MLIACLFAFQVKHLLADFYWQTEYMLDGKGTYMHPGGICHAGLHGLLSLPILLLLAPASEGIVFLLCLAETLVHYHIDWSKEQILRRFTLTPQDRPFWMAVGTDQALHQATMLAMVWVAFGR